MPPWQAGGEGSDGSAGGALVTLVEDEGSLQREVHDEMRRGMRTISSHKVFDEDAPGEIVIALLFTPPIGVVDDLEWLHLPPIGKPPSLVKVDLLKPR